MRNKKIIIRSSAFRWSLKRSAKAAVSNTKILRPPASGLSGFALIAVIGILGILLVLVIAAQGSVQMTLNMDRVGSDRLERQVALASILEEASRAGAPAEQALRIKVNPSVELEATVTRRALAPADPVWARLPGNSYVEGDVLVGLQWSVAAAGMQSESYLVNELGRRRGAIKIPTAANE
jgi:hypothetical protein